ncbi:DUF4336 domain-containing protein [Candidatus Uabimicrobium sp. HlEnr_7]|uniref:DUF4336 domain-containing protein n=1 Tax=Candidatus Uabimicrobium helgolandensis TaxID=3095367 RepID=UPI00355914DE
MLESFGKNIWIVKTPLKFVGLEIGTRMTVIRLNNGELFLHSPVKLTDELFKELKKLGTVKYIVSPNKLHHLFMADYLAFPQVKLYASPGLVRKRKDLNFESELGDIPDKCWQSEIDQMIFRGSFFLKEVVFFHKQSKTLILTDIIQEHEDHRFLPKLIAKFLGVYKKKAVPRELRLTMTNKQMVRNSVAKIQKWDFEKIVFSHASLVVENAKEILKQQFSIF